MFFSVELCFSQQGAQEGEFTPKFDSIFKRVAPQIISGGELESPAYNTLTLSTADAEIRWKANLFPSREKIRSISDYLLLNFSSKSTNGISPLFSNQKISPQFKIGVDYGAVIQFLGKIFWMKMILNYTRAEYTLIDRNQSFANQISSKSFSGFGYGASEGMFTTLAGRPLILSISALVEDTNNADLLKLTTVEDRTNYYDSTTKTNRSFLTTTTGMEGTYSRINVITSKLEVMHYLTKSNSLAIYQAIVQRAIYRGALLQTGVPTDLSRVFSLISGIYFQLKSSQDPKDTKKISFGLRFTFDDLTNAQKRENQPVKFTASFVTGIPFLPDSKK